MPKKFIKDYFDEGINNKICNQKPVPKKKRKMIPIRNHSWYGKNSTINKGIYSDEITKPVNNS